MITAQEGWRVEGRARSGGARLILRNPDGIGVHELVLDDPQLAHQALVELAIALGGGIEYGVVTKHGPYERVTPMDSEAKAKEHAKEDQLDEVDTKVVSRVVETWLTNEERGNA